MQTEKELLEENLLLGRNSAVRRTLDESDVASNLVSGHFEVNISRNRIVGDVSAIGEDGEYNRFSPEKGETGQLSYEEFLEWLKSVVLFEGSVPISSRYDKNSLIASFYRGEKFISSEILVKGAKKSCRKMKVSVTLSQLKNGDIYGYFSFSDNTEKESGKAGLQLLELAAALSESFECLFYVDIHDESYEVIDNRTDPTRPRLVFSGRDFFQDFAKQLRALVHKNDFTKLSTFLTKENLLAEFEKGTSTAVSTFYQLMLETGPVYYRMRASMRRSDADHVLIALENVHDSVTKDLLYQERVKRDKEIIEVLSSEYSTIYCVNLAMNSVEVCKSDRLHEGVPSLGSMEGVSYTEAFRHCVNTYVCEPDRAAMLEAGSIYNILMRLKDHSSYSTIYRIKENGKLHYGEMKVARMGEDEFPEEVVIGFADKSAEKAAEIERKLNIQNILSLSNNLEAVIEVNLNTGDYVFRTPATQEEEEAGARNAWEGILGEDGMREYISAEVYKDDQSLFHPYLTTTGIRNTFKTNPRFEVTYRCLNGTSYVWRSMRGVLNTQNKVPVAVIGIYNIDREYRSEQQRTAEAKTLEYRAYIDTLTGIRNRNAYASTEEELNQKLLAGTVTDMAVAVFDINNLKRTNDTLGHEKGDELIRTASRLICTTFQHSPVFRIGGDEFTALLFGEEYANREKLLAEIHEKSGDAGGEEPLFSVGMAERIETDRTVSDIFKRADRAMYEEKTAGRE